jgi:hypothetical protein
VGNRAKESNVDDFLDPFCMAIESRESSKQDSFRFIALRARVSPASCRRVQHRVVEPMRVHEPKGIRAEESNVDDFLDPFCMAIESRESSKRDSFGVRDTQARVSPRAKPNSMSSNKIPNESMTM